MTGVLPNGSLPSLVRKQKPCAYLRNKGLAPVASFGSGSNLEKRRIISEIAAHLSTTTQYFTGRYARKWSCNDALQVARPRGKFNRFATISSFAAVAQMNDRFKDKVSAPFALSEMPVTMMANAIRALAMDAVQAANSGHPGMPMGMAEIAVALWGRHLSHNPANPHWPNRDRFVLSNGHGSMLQYALLHLTGYDLPLDELRKFRQLHSHTPGHPELGVTPGVETTTGPLGQGFANAVGMALAEKLLAAEFNRPAFEIVDHNTYVFVGDGCMMEGISHEAASLAGTWQLNRLIAVYDDNGISIDGEVKDWFTDNTPQRFDAYGWHVIGPIDGHDVEAVDRAIAMQKGKRPSRR